jgi:transcriptional regulator with XRE-family HTH domain
MDLADRLRALVERDFQGNVNRAAKTWDVPQPTLFRYVNGRTRAPKAEVLQKIAKFYETSVDWLLSGLGVNPLESQYPIADFRAWERLVKSLNLPEAVERLVLPLPSRIQAAHYALCKWGGFPGSEGRTVSHDPPMAVDRAASQAGAMEFEAWGVWLRGLITSYGKLAVRNKLISEVDRISIGYQPFALYLQMSGRLPAYISAIYDTEFHHPKNRFAFHFVNKPPRPPLRTGRKAPRGDAIG